MTPSYSMPVPSQGEGVLIIVMNCILWSALVGRYTDGERNLLLLHSTRALYFACVHSPHTKIPTGRSSYINSYTERGVSNTIHVKFYILLTVHPCIILSIKPTWCTIFLSMFISFLYTFRATKCPSSGETNVFMQHLVPVILCGWLSGMHPYRITSTECHINTVVSPDNGHIVARNVYRKEINILR
jgi:hypothetical protein